MLCGCGEKNGIPKMDGFIPGKESGKRLVKGKPQNI
jgi:hypothetical protein